MKKTFLYETPLFTLKVSEEKGFLTELDFVTDKQSVQEELAESILLKEAYKQLKEYFAGTRQDFDLPLAPQGTEFQKKVWSALCKIPYGQTRSYKDIAEFIDNPKGCRAVGMANSKNPIPIIIPCHRVIAADGTIGGFSSGLAAKRKLLQLEGITWQG